ncbi:MAG: hypothetical protein OEY59_12980, partial [Deltaproteobacteria bacterium]|nr:hypothetical protein [Deltaproteobacteria bacterium]
MKHPPYHLRLNKAVDRLLLIEIINRLSSLKKLTNYTYYGFGGPFLEDFRLLYEHCPGLNMVSIERDEETFKRQHFHLPCNKITLSLSEMTDYINQLDVPDKDGSVVWLDYTDLKPQAFDDFGSLLTTLNVNSVVKVTLQSSQKSYENKQKEFKNEFSEFIPESLDYPRSNLDFAHLLQKMLRIATQKNLQGENDLVFQPLESYYYKDSCGMFSFTGIICCEKDVKKIKKIFKELPNAFFEWQCPKIIDVPALSTKERLYLQR